MNTQTTAVALRPSGRLEISDDQSFWSPEQVAALQVLGIKGATNGDLSVFFHYCRRTELDPFSRQIYYIKRREYTGGAWAEKWTIQVGIDGFRVMRDRVAARTGSVAEFEDTLWYDGDGGVHKVWLVAEPPAACQVVLVKHDLATGRALRFPAVLRTASYMAMKDGKPTGQWRTQPEHMIEKCAEAFATRRAFPNDFSGVYLEEEMQGRRPEADPPSVRRVRAADIIVTQRGAEEMADRMGPAPKTSDPVAKPEPGDPPVTAQDVNAEFKRLGFGVKDKDDVLAAAVAFCDRAEPVKALADLSAEELAGVAYRLSGCETREDVTDLHALIVESQGPGDGELAAEAGGGTAGGDGGS